MFLLFVLLLSIFVEIKHILWERKTKVKRKNAENAEFNKLLKTQKKTHKTKWESRPFCGYFLITPRWESAAPHVVLIRGTCIGHRLAFLPSGRPWETDLPRQHRHEQGAASNKIVIAHQQHQGQPVEFPCEGGLEFCQGHRGTSQHHRRVLGAGHRGHGSAKSKRENAKPVLFRKAKGGGVHFFNGVHDPPLISIKYRNCNFFVQLE